jgi:thiamine-phosphate pyrophosphorylase
MTERSLLYYITDRAALSRDEPGRRRRLLEKIGHAARAGVDYIQLREKDLSTRELESLAREVRDTIARARAEHPQCKTKLLINSRVDIALAANADGVHLRSTDISPGEVRAVWETCWPASSPDGRPARPVRRPRIGVSCHSWAEVTGTCGATFAVFGPVFEKPGSEPAGLSRLHQACQGKMPVLALGGITLSNARSCLEAGAAGVAAIRLFQENDVAETVEALRRVLG